MIAPDRNPLRVLHILGRMDRAGAELRTLDVMHELGPSRCESHFCALSGQVGALDPEILRAGGYVHYLGLSPLFPVRFLRLLRRWRYDVVHSHVQYFSGFLLWLARLARVAVRVAHFHTTDDGQGQSPRRRLQRWVMKRLIRRHASAVISVSQGVMRTNWGLGSAADSRFRVLYEGVGLEVYGHCINRARMLAALGIDASSKICIHVGRLDPPKNHLRLIEIFRELRHVDASVHLVLIGRGGNDLERAMLARANATGLSAYVHLLGVRDDVPAWLQASDLLLFPSLFEGLPGVVIEAGAAGLPVLASDLPGIQEIAVRCRGITCLSLAEDDQTWALVASRLLRAGVARAGIPREPGFPPGSDFDIRVYAQRLYDVWLDCLGPRVRPDEATAGKVGE
jgi:glycosyltransferase involved in cell wall biosynthesis